MRVGLTTTAIFGDLGGYVFENFRDTASNILWRYATPCRPANECKMNDPEWPRVAISWQNAFSASTSWTRAFECQKITQPLRFCCVLCIAYQLASLGRHAQLTRCFSAVAELLVPIGVPLVLTLYLQRISRYWGSNVSGSQSWPF